MSRNVIPVGKEWHFPLSSKSSSTTISYSLSLCPQRWELSLCIQSMCNITHFCFTCSWSRASRHTTKTEKSNANKEMDVKKRSSKNVKTVAIIEPFAHSNKTINFMNSWIDSIRSDNDTCREWAVRTSISWVTPVPATPIAQWMHSSKSKMSSWTITNALKTYRFARGAIVTIEIDWHNAQQPGMVLYARRQTHHCVCYT